MSTVKIGPSRTKKLSLMICSISWILAALLNVSMHYKFIYIFQLVAIIGFLIFSGIFAHRPPVQITFVVGIEELHEVKYKHTEAVAETYIYVDGKTLIKPERFWGEPRSEKIEFTIGDQEKHEVQIERSRSPFGAFWIGTAFTIIIDDVVLRAEQVKVS